MREPSKGEGTHGNFSGNFIFNFPFCEPPWFSEFRGKKFQLGNFQGRQILKNFELPVFKGGSHKSVIINQGFLFFIFYFFGFFFCVSFLIILMNDELNKLINDENYFFNVKSPYLQFSKRAFTKITIITHF